MGETAVLSEFVATTTLEDVPEADIDHAKEAIRDYLGVAIFGSHHTVGDKIHRYVKTAADGMTGTVIGRTSASPTGAALANGTFGHAIDYDDTFESIVIHPTSPIFSAALATTEHVDGSMRECLTGYIIGCDVAYRVGQSTYPEHYQNGWHATGTIGPFGATAAAASILGLQPAAIRRAFGITGSASSSLKKNFGSMTKPLHAGHAAQTGVRAALLAADGFTADSDVFEGDLGYGSVMTVDSGFDPAELTDSLGDWWAVSDIGYKPYPSGVITHAAMDALRALVTENDLDPDEVGRIVVTLDDAASEMLIHAKPDDQLQAKFSIEFCLAAILREGDAGIYEFTDDYVTAKRTRDVIEKVERAFEPDLFGDDYAGYGAIVRVETTDGETFTAEERYAPGSPNNPLNESRLRDKYMECVESQFSSDRAVDIESTIRSLDQPESITSLTNLLVE